MITTLIILTAAAGAAAGFCCGAAGHLHHVRDFAGLTRAVNMMITLTLALLAFGAWAIIRVNA